MKMKYLFFAVISLGLIFSIPTDDSQKLEIVGSSSVQPICEELVEEYRKTNPDVDVNVQGGGSSLGIKSADLNIADIGMSSKEVNGSNLKVHEIGREGIVVIVNPQNPVSDLSGEELKNIFSGKNDTWSDGSEINVIVREEGSGTLDVFKEEIMGDASIRKDAIVQNSAGSVKHSVMQDENAIGFISLCHLDGDVKDIRINGVKVCEKSIGDGTYPLQRPFIFITNETPSNDTMEFINWCESDCAKEILIQEKIISGD